MFPRVPRRAQPGHHENGLMIFMKAALAGRRAPSATAGGRGGGYHAAVPDSADRPPLPTDRSHVFDAPGGHRLHVRDLGPEGGLPVLLLHGGPGSGATPRLWQGFDLARYRVIVPDQRGAGASTPRGSVLHNTTADLLADLRRLRAALGLARWLVVGGSWGATLALAHALDTPAAVSGLLLRSTFLARPEDIDRFFAAPADREDPAWQRLHGVAGDGPPLTALHAALHGADRAAVEQAARAWWTWECTLQGTPQDGSLLQGDALAHQIDRYRVQSHYLVHACWLEAPPLPERCADLAPMPVLLLHGREDRICPPAGAALLHARLPQSRLEWVPGAGHDPGHPAMAAAFAAALTAWADQGSWA